MDTQPSAIESSEYDSERAIYIAAVKISDRGEREAFLQRVCRGDVELMSRLDRLITARATGIPNPLQEAVASSKVTLDGATPRLNAEAMLQTRHETSGETIDITHQPVIDRYKLIEEIGQGGMGTVYLAEQSEPVRRRVAVKVINPGMNSREILVRFEAERQALAMMDHPNIASVLDGGTTESGLPYFVMELVRGVPITEHCRRSGMNLRDRLNLFIDLCYAVHHAHQRGIIHRDLKPSNVLVAEHDDIPVVKVIDFGVAKALSGELTDRTLLTQASQLVGTPIYMSPEQAIRNESAVDTRCDVYSLGVVLYELLTGSTPIERSTLSQLGFDQFCLLVTQKDPPRPSQRSKSKTSATPAAKTAEPSKPPTSFAPKLLKGELDWIVMKAIDRDRDQRYTSAAEFADDVKRYLRGEPVIACPPSLTYRLRKTVSQNRVAVSILAVIVAALATVAVTSRWQISAVEQARRETEIREQRAIDLLHALKLQGALTAFRNDNLVLLDELTSDLRSDPLLLSGHSRPTDLIDLLSEVARRPTRASFDNSSPVHDLAATPDQEQIVSVDENGDVKLWSVGSSTNSSSTNSVIVIGSHGEPAHAVAISPDGQLAVSGSTSGQIQYWNLVERRLIKTLKPAESGIETIRWSPDGQTVAAGSRYSEVWVGDRNGKERFRITNDHRHESFLFSADSNELIIPNRQDVGVYDVSSGERRRSISTQPLSNVRTLCFAGKNDRWLIAGERHRENLAVFDYASGKLLSQIPLGRTYPRAITASSDGLWLRVSFTSGEIQIVRLSPSEGGSSAKGTVWSEFRAHDPAPDDRLPLGILKINSRFVSGGVDGRIHIWDQFDLTTVEERRRPGTIVASYLIPESGDVYHVYRDTPHPMMTKAQTFSDRLVGGFFAVALDKKIYVVRAMDRRVIAEIDSPIDSHRSVAIADSGRVILATSADSLCVWRTSDDWNSIGPVNRFEIEHQATPVLCDRGETIIVDDDLADQLLAIDVDTKTTKTIADVSRVKHLCLDSDEKRIGIVLDDGIRVIDRNDFQSLFEAKNLANTGQLRFMNDGVTLLDCRRDGNLHVWHLTTRQRLGLLYRPDFTLGTLVRWNLAHESPRMLLEFADDYGGTHLLVTPSRGGR